MPAKDTSRYTLVGLILAAAVLFYYRHEHATPGTGTSSSVSSSTSGRADDNLKLSSADRAMRAKLDPSIDCLNDELSHFESLEASYHDNLKGLMAPPGSDLTHFNVNAIFNNSRFFMFYRSIPPAQACADTLEKASTTSPSVPDFDAAAREDGVDLRAIIDPGRQMDTYLDQKGYLDDHFAKARSLDAVLSPLFVRMNKATGELRGSMHRENAVLDQHRLDALEKADGRTLPWHTQRSMMAARALNDQLKSALHENRLDAGVAQAAIQPLQTSVDDAQAFIHSHPEVEKANSNGLKPMWFSLTGDFDRELAAARDLRAYLQTPPSADDTPRERSDKLFRNFESVNSAFNGLIESFNNERKSRHPVMNSTDTQ